MALWIVPEAQGLFILLKLDEPELSLLYGWYLDCVIGECLNKDKLTSVIEIESTTSNILNNRNQLIGC